MTRGNPTSLRGQVRVAFQSGGEAAARAKGKELKLPEGKINRWIRKFSGASTPTVRTGRQRIALSYWPERTGYLLREGPEQSEVHLDEGGFHIEVNRKILRLKE